MFHLCHCRLGLVTIRFEAKLYFISFMKAPKYLASLVLLIGTAATLMAADVPQETPAQHDARMAWFREARFGLFIHWGVYSVPAGEWNGKTGYGEWFLEETKMPVSQYEKFASQFNPVKFDANEWVRLAKNAGMKYIVITSKHHDGFGMFRSDLTDWCIKSNALPARSTEGII
jgi:alpha-L-fucosidase